MKGVDYSKLNNSELLSLAKEAVTEIRNSLPNELYAGSFTLESKLPWKATVFRELLLHRFSDFVEVAVELYETGRFIPVKVAERRTSTAIVERVPKAGYGDTKKQ